MMLETKVAVMISCLLFDRCLFRGGQRRKASTSGGGQEREDPYGFRVILVGLESGLETFRDLWLSSSRSRCGSQWRARFER